MDNNHFMAGDSNNGIPSTVLTDVSVLREDLADDDGTFLVFYEVIVQEDSYQWSNFITDEQLSGFSEVQQDCRYPYPQWCGRGKRD